MPFIRSSIDLSGADLPPGWAALSSSGLVCALINTSLAARPPRSRPSDGLPTLRLGLNDHLAAVSDLAFDYRGTLWEALQHMEEAAMEL